MIYIKKTQPPKEILEYIELENREFADNYSEEERLTKYPRYNFNAEQRGALKKRLFEEQRALCCYCMRTIEINNPVSSKNATVEHFLPDSVFKENCADYFNLYLVCPNLHKDEDGKEETLDEQHCDKFKGNYLIPKFIGYFHREDNGAITKCEDFFRYNAQGYILPNGNFTTFDEYKTNYSGLTVSEKAALLTIETLNLNADVLRKERLQFIKDSIQTKIFPLTEKQELEKILDEYETEERKEFAGVALYFINQKLNRT